VQVIIVIFGGGGVAVVMYDIVVGVDFGGVVVYMLMLLAMIKSIMSPDAIFLVGDTDGVMIF
jgi:hypothetical protein